MAQLTVAAFLSKWASLFPSTGNRSITAERMRDFRQDIADSFQSIAGAVSVTSWKSPCAVATTGNITLSGEQTIDGVLTSGSRVLVKNQTTTSQNGIYVSAAGAWSRSTDADDAAELEGAAVGVTQGTTQQNTVWLQTSDNITLGSTAIQWQQIGFGGGTQTLASVLTTGNDAGGLAITNLDDPTNAQDAATKAYVDAQVAGSGITNSAANNQVMISDGTNAIGDTGLTWDAVNDVLTVDGARIHTTGGGTASLYLGNGAGNLSATGGANLGVGTSALSQLANGQANTAIGVNALLLLSTGSNNTAIGSGSLDTVTGSRNTSIGTDSGGAALGADDNTLIGYSAGDNITTGDNNIIIGSQIDAPSATNNNQLSIQNIIFGTGNSGTGTTPSTGSIGIGISAPATKLDVDGPVRVKSYTVAGVPSASSIAGAMIYVSDESGGAVIAFSDGTNWRRVTDRAIIS